MDFNELAYAIGYFIGDWARWLYDHPREISYFCVVAAIVLLIMNTIDWLRGKPSWFNATPPPRRR